MLAQIDPARMNTTMTKLVSFGTHHTLSSMTDPMRGIGAACDWLAAEMRTLAAGAPHISIAVPSYIQPTSRILVPTNVSHVVATISGASTTNHVNVVMDHYDSRVTDIMNFTDDAPGAGDNVSGVAVVLELLRTFATRPQPPATIILAAVAGEEHGLSGATFLTGLLKVQGVDFQGMFTNAIDCQRWYARPVQHPNLHAEHAHDGDRLPDFDVRVRGQGE